MDRERQEREEELLYKSILDKIGMATGGSIGGGRRRAQEVCVSRDTMLMPVYGPAERMD